MATAIHPTAVLDPGAELGEDVEIGPYAVVGAEVKVGDRCRIDSGVQLTGPTVLGSDNRIYSHACIGFDPQDKKFQGERATCEIGDRNKIREHVTIHRGTGNGGGVTRLGSDNLIMVAAHVAHDCRIGDDIIIANQVMMAGHVCVEVGANIGEHSRQRGPLGAELLFETAPERGGQAGKQRDGDDERRDRADPRSTAARKRCDRERAEEPPRGTQEHVRRHHERHAPRQRER